MHAPFFLKDFRVSENNCTFAPDFLTCDAVNSGRVF